MTGRDYSEYQKNLINNYYANRDTIMLNRLGELVTELYLADTEAKRKRLWKSAHKAMLNLKVPPAIIEHIMSKQDVEILAKNLKEWYNRKSR